MKGIQDTSSKTLRQLLGNALTYEIPKFQRDYSWNTEQWDDLWNDIMAIYKHEEQAHYLGYLVLQTENDKKFRVIDGQQRMISLSLWVLAGIKRLQNFVNNEQEVAANQQRINTFRDTYLGYLDPVSLISVNKLKLNRNNDSFYRQYLVPLQELPKRGLNASEKLMKNCFNWYYDAVCKQFNDGKNLATFIDSFVDKLFFTVITVNNELNAFKVFETLNARGVKLSSADLLKNYLFSVIDKNKADEITLEEVETLWASIIDKLGNQNIADFLWIYWNSCHKTIRKNNLFKTIRKHINDQAEAFGLLRKLRDKVDVYMALRNPYDSLWHGHNQKK